MREEGANWKRSPFLSGVAIPYQATFDHKASERVRAGVVPQDLDDRWLIVHEAPHLFVHRSWTGLCVYRLALVDRPEGLVVTEALWASELAKPYRSEDLEQAAQVLDALVRQVLLGEAPPAPLPAPEEPEPTLRRTTGAQPVIEAPPAAPATRPWWKLWG